MSLTPPEWLADWNQFSSDRRRAVVKAQIDLFYENRRGLRPVVDLFCMECGFRCVGAWRFDDHAPDCSAQWIPVNTYPVGGRYHEEGTSPADFAGALWNRKPNNEPI